MKEDEQLGALMVAGGVWESVVGGGQRGDSPDGHSMSLNLSQQP